MMIVDNLERLRQDLKIALELIENFVIICEATNGIEEIR